MCGIVGYVGFRPAPEFLIDGLRRLEYRGYDSAGIAVQPADEIGIRKRAGRVEAVSSTHLPLPTPNCLELCGVADHSTQKHRHS